MMRYFTSYLIFLIFSANLFTCSDILEESSKLYQKVQAIFTLYTGDSGAQIYDYEIEHWPRYVPINFTLWDRVAVDEIGEALTSLKFRKKPQNWRPNPLVSNEDNERLVALAMIKVDLLLALTRCTEFDLQDLDEIPWREIDHDPLAWDPLKILKIHRKIQEHFNQHEESESENSNASEVKNEFTSSPFDINELVLKRLQDDVPSSNHSRKRRKLLGDEGVKKSRGSRTDPTCALLEVMIDLMDKFDYEENLAEDWTNFSADGWPEGVSFDPSEWSSEDLIKIKGAMDGIEFHRIEEPSDDDSEAPQEKQNDSFILTDEQYYKSWPSDNLNLEITIMSQLIKQKIESDLGIKIDNFNLYNYYIENWPRFLPKSSKHWDTEAIFELKTVLPRLVFTPIAVPVINNSRIDSVFTFDEAINHFQMLRPLLLEKIEVDTGIRITKNIPWDDLLIENWPKDLPKHKSLRRKPLSAQLIYRALPSIRFQFKYQEL